MTPGLANAVDAKLEPRCRARAALLGGTLLRTTTDDGRVAWLFTRWHLTRELQTLDEVEDLLDSMGAPG